MFEIGEFGGFLDAPLDRVLGFQGAGLGRHQAEHSEAIFLQALERRKAAGAVGVVFHEIAVHLDLVEQHFLLGFVAARAHEGRFVVAAAQMHGHRHVRRNVGHRDVNELAVKRAERFGIVAAVLHLLAIFRIAQHGYEHFVELQVAAAGISESTHGFFVRLAEIVEHRVELGIDRLVDRCADRATVQRRRRRDRYLWRTLGVRLDKFEMPDHRMAREADLAGDLGAFVARPGRGEGDAGLHDGLLDAVEAPEEIQMPPRAAEFAVGDRLQAGVFLLPDDVLDLTVFHRLQLVRRDLALGAALARFFQRRGPQQAADMIGAERRFGSLHGGLLSYFPPPKRGRWRAKRSRWGSVFVTWASDEAADPHPTLPLSGGGLYYPHTSSATSTIIRSFAHSSSSARTLPSSVEAKPHCGDRQSWSMSTNFAACSMRRLISSRLSSRPDLLVTKPSTTVLSLGRKRSGSKPPARSVSYSMK